MAIKGATFDLQTVLAKYDGAMYNALSNNHDGYVSWTGSGNPITFTDTNVLTLKNGYILVHGRLIVVDGATGITLNPGSSISSGDGRLVLQIDTSKTNTQTVLNQVEILQEYKATSASWRALSTDDINALSTGVYEVQLCHFTVANGTSSGVQIDISTDTIIGNLQDDIETLADNLEQTASDVGDLQALGLSVPIPVNKGGSGLTSSPSMLTNLASNAAAGIFQASPRPGVTGTLPIGNGGTGASTAANAITNLGAVGQYFNSSATDLNTMLTAGIYRLQTNVTNYPSGATSNYSTLFVIRGTSNADTATQVFSSYNDDNLWYRKVRGVSSTPSFGSWVRWTGFKDITKVTYINSALTGLQAKRLQVSSQAVIQGYGFVTATANADHITLPAGTYRIHTNFRANPGANGFIKTCLKIGNTSTLFVITDQFYAGAGCGTNGSIIGVNATDVINLTASTDIYFLVMSQNNTEGCEGSLTIERLG